MTTYECPVCAHRGLQAKPYQRWPPPSGLELSPPYEDLLGRPSYEVCRRCGFEFGNDDNPGTAAPSSFEEYGEEWRADGSPWFWTPVSEASIFSAVPSDQWLACEDPNGVASQFWPVVEYGKPRCALGLAETGEWSWCELSEARLHPLRPRYSVGVLPLLELPYEAVVETARRAAKAAGVAPDRIEAELPSRAIVEAALRSSSDHWVNLGAEWLANAASQSHASRQRPNASR